MVQYMFMLRRAMLEKKQNNFHFHISFLDIFDCIESSRIHVCFRVSPQATGADRVLRGQCGCSRHRADAVHQCGLLQAEETATRLACDVLTGLRYQAENILNNGGYTVYSKFLRAALGVDH